MRPKRFGLPVSCSLLVLLLALSMSLITTTSLKAVSASPELIEQLRQSGQLEKFVQRMAAAKAKGVCSAEPHLNDAKDKESYALQMDPNAVDTFRALIILVDFSDNPATGGGIFAQPIDFQNLVFSNDPNDSHYSVTENYIDNSYGDFFLEGDIVGWYRMPQTYAYYVDGQTGFGSYPNNAQRLAQDAVIAANPDVDYNDYDIDNNGQLDGVFVVHAGAGAEATGSDNMIWSHKWNMPTTVLDGIAISAYTMEPEEAASGGLTTMGVFAHEYGHFLGLPDLYDTDYSSAGIGRWSLMAGGSWNDGGRHPAFMDAWCKKEVGFLTLTNVNSSMADVELPQSYHNPVAYRLWENGVVGSQYFLIENRQAVENDRWISGSGLLIMHIDEAIGGNSNELHPLVAIEQADGKLDLENDINNGDGGDIWTSSVPYDFDDLSMPNTRKYSGFPLQTKTAVWGISASDSVMTAGFDITYARPRYELMSQLFSDATFGNNDGIIDLGERIEVTFSLQNLWLTATNVTATLTSDNNDIDYVTPTVNIGSITGEGGTGNNLSIPIVFDVPSDFETCIDSFFLEVSSDNGNDTKVFGFLINVGVPDVLVVDDDNGTSEEFAVTSQLFSRRIPFDIWDKSVQGAPDSTDLNAYGTVIWTIGPARTNIMSSLDVDAMKGFMDGGGNLFLTGQSIIEELDSDDQSFLNNYLKAEFVTEILWPFMLGQSGSIIGDGINIRYGSQTNQSEPAQMTAVNGGVSNFELQSFGGSTGITYSSSYKLVLFSFGFEAISDQFALTGYTTGDTVFQRVLDFFYPPDESMNPLITSSGLQGEVTSNVVGHVPTFEWTATDTLALPIVEYEVRVGTGNNCHNSDNMWAPATFSGSAGSIVYGGLPLEDGLDYAFQVRVSNGTTWSSWKVVPFHLNQPATPGFIVAPRDDQQVVTTTPQLNQTIGTDPEGSPLTYAFEIYSDAALTNLVTSAEFVPKGTPTTKWTVDLPLTEDQQYFWRGRAHDGFEYSEYTETASFYVNETNQAPLPFNLLSPNNGALVFDIYPRLTWAAVVDPDPGDSTFYRLLTSLDAGFGTFVETNDLVDTFRTLTYPLNENETYFWKVEATDLASAMVTSTQTFSMKIKGAGGCCFGTRGNANNDAGDNTNISDVTFLVNYLFGIPSGPEPACWEEGNVNGDPGESVNIADITYLVDYLFGVPTGPEPPLCP